MIVLSLETKRTYIIGYCNHSVRITTYLASHTSHAHVVYVNFIYEWRDMPFKVNFERKIFEKFFIAILFIHKVFARNLLSGEVTEELLFILMFDLVFEPWA